MKKMLTACLLFIATLTAWAGDYDYVVVVNENQSTMAFASMGLSMAFGDGAIVVTTADGEQTTLNLDDLALMYFSAEPGAATAIQHIDIASDEPVTLYTATGALAGHFATINEALQSVQPGVYLVKGQRVVKKIVKK